MLKGPRNVKKNVLNHCELGVLKILFIIPLRPSGGGIEPKAPFDSSKDGCLAEIVVGENIGIYSIKPR